MTRKHSLIKLRRGTASEWTLANEILSLGEPGFEKDTNKLKIGDGTTPWNSLPYINGGSPISTEDIEDLLGNSGFLVAGSGIVLNYDDNNDTLTISSSGVANTGDITFNGSTISTANTNQDMTITTNGSGDIFIGADRNMIFDMNAWSGKGILLQDSQEDGYDDPNTPSLLKVGSIYHQMGRMIIESDGRVQTPSQVPHLLFHFNNNFEDSGPNNITVNPQGYVEVSNTQSKFGNYSLYLDGNSTLTINDTLAFNSNDFTIQLWVYVSSYDNSLEISKIIGRGDIFGSGPEWLIGIHNSGGLCFMVNGDAIVGSTPVSLNSWHHVAVTREGDVFRLFLNGNEESSFTNPTSIASTFPLTIGDNNNSTINFVGFVDDLVIINNTALYTSNFSVPTSEYSLFNLTQTYGGLWITNGDNTGLSIPSPSGVPYEDNELSILNNSNEWKFKNNGDLELPEGKTISWGQNSNTLGPPIAGGGTDRVRLWDFKGSGTNYNYAIGAEPNHVWFAMDVNNGEGGFKYYSRNNEIFKISDDSKLIFPNGTTIASGTFDNGTGGNNGISLNCAVGYELNWQGGHLKSTTDNGLTAANIICESTIEFPGSGINNLKIDGDGIVFVDGSILSSASGIGGGNPFDQNLNTSNNPTFTNLNLNNSEKIVLPNNTIVWIGSVIETEVGPSYDPVFFIPDESYNLTVGYMVGGNVSLQCSDIYISSIEEYTYNDIYGYKFVLADNCALESWPNPTWHLTNPTFYSPSGQNVNINFTTKLNDVGSIVRDNNSGDGSNKGTFKIIPDNSLLNNDQYLIVDPTAPNHIHLRAGGTIDDSMAELIVGGEHSYVKVGVGLNPQIQVSANDYNWTFNTSGEFIGPNGATIGTNGEGSLGFYNSGNNNSVAIVNRNIDSGANLALVAAMPSANGGLVSVAVATSGVNSYEYWDFKDDGVLELASGGIKFSDSTTQNTAWTGSVAISEVSGLQNALNLKSDINTPIFALGTLSGSNAINFGSDRMIQTLTLNGSSVTFTKGTGWPSDNTSVDIVLRIVVTSPTSIIWSIVTDWFNQPAAGSLAVGTHLFLLRNIGASIVEAHYIGSKTN